MCASTTRAPATRVVRETQREDGAWVYPLPERKHLIATVEGDFGAATMLEAFERDGDPTWLDAALKWHSSRARDRLPGASGRAVHELISKAARAGAQQHLRVDLGAGALRPRDRRQPLSRKGAADAQVPRGRLENPSICGTFSR